MEKTVVLGSSSRYRAELLSRLEIDFTCLAPDIDEKPLLDESARQLSARLARQKAHAVRDCLLADKALNPPSQLVEQLIIASDQTASSGDLLLGKPGSIDAACEQLLSISGSTVCFYTALHMLNAHTNEEFATLDITQVQVRNLDSQSIRRYVERERPLDCAGSFKAESLGISLFDSISSEDPTGLIGLPLISVSKGLRQFGMHLT